MIVYKCITIHKINYFKFKEKYNKQLPLLKFSKFFGKKSTIKIKMNVPIVFDIKYVMMYK